MRGRNAIQAFIGVVFGRCEWPCLTVPSSQQSVRWSGRREGGLREEEDMKSLSLR